MNNIEAMKLALEYLQDNQHHIADNERHVYVMEYNAFIERFERIIAEAEQAEPAPMSQPNRLIAYSAADKLRSLGYQWDEKTAAWQAEQAQLVQRAEDAFERYEAKSDKCLMENAQGDLERVTLVQTGVGIGKAEQAQPVVWMYQDKSTHEVRFQKHMSEFVDHSRTSEVPLYGEPLANHELQCVCGAVWCGDEMVHLPNKKPPRQPLTDEEISDLWCKVSNTDFVTADTHEFARAIEAKLKEKNT